MGEGGGGAEAAGWMRERRGEGEEEERGTCERKKLFLNKGSCSLFFPLTGWSKRRMIIQKLLFCTSVRHQRAEDR